MVIRLTLISDVDRQGDGGRIVDLDAEVADSSDEDQCLTAPQPGDKVRAAKEGM